MKRIKYKDEFIFLSIIVGVLIIIILLRVFLVKG